MYCTKLILVLVRKTLDKTKNLNFVDDINGDKNALMSFKESDWGIEILTPCFEVLTNTG